MKTMKMMKIIGIKTKNELVSFFSFSALSQRLVLSILLIGIFFALCLAGRESREQIQISVAAVDLHPYHQILKSDLQEKTYRKRDISQTTFKESMDILDRYTLTQISQGKPFEKAQLSQKIDAKLITDTATIAIPATPALTLGNSLRAGEIVDIFLVAPVSKGEQNPKALSFKNIVVLDVKIGTDNKIATDSVVLLAIPQQRLPEFLANYAEGKLLISRQM
ncbi:hypothetical protein ACN4EG_21130 [Alkalinema pantanalense CENA528]|uniref:hypothetical protein n=1 Tax=Alkalinema pantanalense TaxID=1620705 RepID=UPI003D6EE7D7